MSYTGDRDHLRSESPTSSISGVSTMEPARLHNDFKEFLKLLRENDVRYLLIGGFAVGYHGYPRATNDIDIWIAPEADNIDRTFQCLMQFGFDTTALQLDWLKTPEKILRLGYPPVRIDLMTTISGVAFNDAYQRRITDDLDGEPVSLIGLEDLRTNKKAAGRHKDLDDLEHLGDRNVEGDDRD